MCTCDDKKNESCSFDREGLTNLFLVQSLALDIKENRFPEKIRKSLEDRALENLINELFLKDEIRFRCLYGTFRPTSYKREEKQMITEGFCELVAVDIILFTDKQIIFINAKILVQANDKNYTTIRIVLKTTFLPYTQVRCAGFDMIKSMQDISSNENVKRTWEEQCPISQSGNTLRFCTQTHGEIELFFAETEDISDLLCFITGKL